MYSHVHCGFCAPCALHSGPLATVSRGSLALAVDLIAERIRALGVFAPGSYRTFAKLSRIAEEDDHPSAMEMVRNLVTAHETVVRTAREAFPAAEKAGDEATLDLLTQRLLVHEKTAWMLRVLLEEPRA